jgi:hypothetical protein
VEWGEGRRDDDDDDDNDIVIVVVGMVKYCNNIIKMIMLQ